MPKDTTDHYGCTRPAYKNDGYGWDEVHRIAPAANTNQSYRPCCADASDDATKSYNYAPPQISSTNKSRDDSDMDWDWATTDVYARYGRVSSCRSTNGWPEDVDDSERYWEEFERLEEEHEYYRRAPHSNPYPQATPRFMDYPAFRCLVAVASREFAEVEAAEVHADKGKGRETPARRRSTRTRTRSTISRTEDVEFMDVPKPRTPAASSHEKKGSRTPEERISGFATDVWVGRFEAKRVICRGCGKTVKLDQRSDYYDGLWIKHRQRCRKIKAGVRLQDCELVWSLGEDDSESSSSSNSPRR